MLQPLHIDDNLIFVEVFEVSHDEKAMEIWSKLHPTPDHNSPSNILNKLNDDCIQSIFKLLSLRDLCTVADTCTRFQYVAQMVFSGKLEHLKDVDHDLGVKLRNYESDEYHLLLESLIRNFLCLFKSIETLHCDKHNIILDALTAQSFRGNCSIDKVGFYHLLVREASFEFNRVLPLLRLLTSIRLVPCEGNNREFIAFTQAIMKRQFVKLKEFQIRNICGLSDELLDEFMSLNQQLTNIVLKEPEYLHNNISSNIFRSVTLHLGNLEKLEIGGYIRIESGIEQILINLAKLKYLKVIKIYSAGFPVDMLLKVLAKEKTPIEELGFKRFNFDSNDFINISILTQLNTMRLCYMNKHAQDKHHYIKEITRAAENVSILDFHTFTSAEVVINTSDFYEIVNLVKIRDNNVCLKIVLSGYKLDVPNNILQENRQWLDVTLKKTSDSSPWKYFFESD